MIKHVRLFLTPIVIALSTYFFDGVNDWREVFSTFSIAFFLNWVADTYIIEHFVGYKGKKDKG